MYQPSPIMPTFDAKNQVLDPRSYVIDCGNYNMLEQPEAHPDLCKKMKQQFKNSGLVLLTNTGLAKNKSMIEVWSKVPLGNTWKYEGGANERNYLKEEGTEEESGLYRGFWKVEIVIITSFSTIFEHLFTLFLFFRYFSSKTDSPFTTSAPPETCT